MSTVRTTVITNFLTSVDADDSLPEPLRAALRDLLTGTGRAPGTEHVVELIRTNATTPDTPAGGAA